MSEKRRRKENVADDWRLEWKKIEIDIGEKKRRWDEEKKRMRRWKEKKIWWGGREDEVIIDKRMRVEKGSSNK